MEEQIHCKSCGSLIPEDSKFCDNCGAIIDKGEKINIRPLDNNKSLLPEEQGTVESKEKYYVPTEPMMLQYVLAFIMLIIGFYTGNIFNFILFILTLVAGLKFQFIPIVKIFDDHLTIGQILTKSIKFSEMNSVQLAGSILTIKLLNGKSYKLKNTWAIKQLSKNDLAELYNVLLKNKYRKTN